MAAVCIVTTYSGCILMDSGIGLESCMQCEPSNTVVSTWIPLNPYINHTLFIWLRKAIRGRPAHCMVSGLVWWVFEANLG